jgi:cellulose synthase/poly-beta-1,6-N-acetylglucosamine synthase-like glycosyltransferase
VSGAFVVAVLEGVIRVTEWLAVVFFLFVNGWYAALLVAAVIEMLEHRRLSRLENGSRLLSSPLTPTISVIAPAFNEEATIVESLHALFGLHYPNLEIVVVNDGSRDRTLDRLRDNFSLRSIHPIYRRLVVTAPVRGLYRSPTHPGLVVVDKENGGSKADAVNAGFNVATGHLVCVMDADTLIEPHALQLMVRPFLEDPTVIAVGGTIRIVNGCAVRGGRVVEPRVPHNAWAGFQVVEYLRAFLFGRLGWNRLGGNLIISGGFGLFDREAVLAAGGFMHDAIGEDIELVTRLRARAAERGLPGRVAFVPDPVAWTEAPDGLRVLGGQRDRWHRGLADTLLRFRHVLFNPRYGVLGLVILPYYLIAELAAPIVEGVGLFSLAAAALLGILNVPFAILFLLVAYGLSAVLTVITFALEEFTFHRYERMSDRLLLLLYAVFENVGYRQLTVYWRLRGLVKYARGRNEWGTMTRRGFQSPAPGTVGEPVVNRT